MSDWRLLVNQGAIVCPATDHGQLAVGATSLTCTVCGRVYPIRDDIPVLLLSDAGESSAGAGQSENL